MTKTKGKMPKGLYIHIPFCKSFCPYCDFFKVKMDEELCQKYTEAVVKTAASYALDFDTVYFGGGTPSVMKSSQIVSMLDAVREYNNVDSDAEITVECNPSSDIENFIFNVADAGVNRISLGMQSAVDEERRLLGRLADRNRVEEVIALVRKAGIENISVDVMLGIPKQTSKSLDETLKFLIDMGVLHVSAYMLKLEEGTIFYQRQDELDLPSEDQVCDFYYQTCDTLEVAGIKQYEISNFGLKSRHNLKYWNCEEYLGIGPYAHSFIDGKRFYFNENLEKIDDGIGGTEEEKIMLGLRLLEGIDVSDKVLEKTKKSSDLREYINIEGSHISLNRKGFLVSNRIISELI
ncbi:MAG: radical SAM family heme chaperone HemW [Ruminococcaceae bacterium]|nr:radical SAM family heme chaperone HemW [Oscillospiraceae bacterium]